MPTKKVLEREFAITKDALETALALSPERDNNFFTGGLSQLYGETRDRWDRKRVFAEALRAWRVNPLARRIVRLMTSFVIGKGITITSDHEGTNAFLQEWWNHPLINMPRNIKRWKDEDTRTGNLFLLCTIGDNGMTFVRAVPAEQIEEIETADNDVEQEIRYTKDAAGLDAWPAYDPTTEQASFMLHSARNKPVGSPWGEADLSPSWPDWNPNGPRRKRLGVHERNSVRQSLRAWCRRHSPAAIRGPVHWRRLDRDKRLHGIGRRRR